MSPVDLAVRPGRDADVVTCPTCGIASGSESAPGSQGGGLTPREMAVLDLVVEGLTDREIGRQLGISPRTVDKHLEHVYSKLDVRGRVAAAIAWFGWRRSGVQPRVVHHPRRVVDRVRT